MFVLGYVLFGVKNKYVGYIVYRVSKNGPPTINMTQLRKFKFTVFAN